MDLNELDRVEILSLQDNYIEMTALDDSDIVREPGTSGTGRSATPSGPSTGFRPSSG